MAKVSQPKIKDLKLIFNSGETNDICFNNDDYWNIKNKWDALGLEMHPNRYDLKRGLYAAVREIKIWVSKNVEKGHIKIYPKDKFPTDQFDSEWSIDIKISDFEKMIKLKSFW